MTLGMLQQGDLAVLIYGESSADLISCGCSGSMIPDTDVDKCFSLVSGLSRVRLINGINLTC